MTDHEFAAHLAAILNGDVDADEAFDANGVCRAMPYDEAGMLTRNAGLVVRMDDGSEYQITIVRSRQGR